MGFREPDSSITLRFEEGDELHGIEVILRGMSIGEYMRATGMDGGDGEDNGKTIERFYKALISWNLEDRATGQPIPVSDAPNRDQKMIRRLNNAYVEALMEVHRSDPLPDSSTSGESFPAPAIPMEPLSQSQAS